jgi:hypothetical protein
MNQHGIEETEKPWERCFLCGWCWNIINTSATRVGATLTKDRPVLSAVRVPHKDRTVTVKNSNKYLVMSPRWGSTPRLTDWLTVSRNVTLTLTCVETGSNTSTVTLRVVGDDEKRRLKSETVKYGHQSHGTRTRERLRWWGPATYTKRDLSFRQRGRPTNKRP